MQERACSAQSWAVHIVLLRYPWVLQPDLTYWTMRASQSKTSCCLFRLPSNWCNSAMVYQENAGLYRKRAIAVIRSETGITGCWYLIQQHDLMGDIVFIQQFYNTFHYWTVTCGDASWFIYSTSSLAPPKQIVPQLDRGLDCCRRFIEIVTDSLRDGRLLRVAVEQGDTSLKHPSAVTLYTPALMASCPNTWSEVTVV